MKIQSNDEFMISDLFLFYLTKYPDERGMFYEQMNVELINILSFVNFEFFQSNVAMTYKSLTFRGLHIQKNEFSQMKVIFCLTGKILDVVIDLRENSPSYLKEEYILLDSKVPCCLIVPEGCAHGYLTLEDNTLVNYYVNKPYVPESETTYNYKMLELSQYINVERLILSEKDRRALKYNEKND